MKRDFAKLRPETVASEGALEMTQAELHHAPVVAPGAYSIGVFAQTDLVRAMLAEMASHGDNNATPLSAAS